MFNHFNVEIGKAVSKNVKGKRFYTTDSGGIYPSITTVLGAKESRRHDRVHRCRNLSQQHDDRQRYHHKLCV